MRWTVLKYSFSRKLSKDEVLLEIVTYKQVFKGSDPRWGYSRNINISSCLWHIASLASLAGKLYLGERVPINDLIMREWDQHRLRMTEFWKENVCLDNSLHLTICFFSKSNYLTQIIRFFNLGRLQSQNRFFLSLQFSLHWREWHFT